MTTRAVRAQVGEIAVFAGIAGMQLLASGRMDSDLFVSEAGSSTRTARRRDVDQLVVVAPDRIAGARALLWITPW